MYQFMKSALEIYILMKLLSADFVKIAWLYIKAHTKLIIEKYANRWQYRVD